MIRLGPTDPVGLQRLAGLALMLGVGRRSIGSGIHNPGSEIWAWIRDPGSRTAPLRRFPSVAFLPSFPYSGFLVQFLMLCFIFSYDGVSQKETKKRPGTHG